MNRKLAEDVGSLLSELSEIETSEQIPQHDDAPDTALIAACLEGDERAWERLLKRYERLIFTIPLRMGFPASMAEEIYQEICLILLEKLETIRDHQRLSTWLFTVTKRLCIQRLRNRKPLTSLDELESFFTEISGLEDQVILVEQQEMVRLAFNSLDPRCQTLLHALFMELPSPTYETISETLQIAVGSIGPTRARCLEKLRQILVLAAPGGN